MNKVSRILNWLDNLGVRFRLHNPEEPFPINILVHQSHRWVADDIQHYLRLNTPQSLVRWAHSMGFHP